MGLRWFGRWDPAGDSSLTSPVAFGTVKVMGGDSFHSPNTFLKSVPIAIGVMTLLLILPVGALVWQRLHPSREEIQQAPVSPGHDSSSASLVPAKAVVPWANAPAGDQSLIIRNDAHAACVPLSTALVLRYFNRGEDYQTTYSACNVDINGFASLESMCNVLQDRGLTTLVAQGVSPIDLEHTIVAGQTCAILVTNASGLGHASVLMRSTDSTLYADGIRPVQAANWSAIADRLGAADTYCVFVSSGRDTGLHRDHRSFIFGGSCGIIVFAGACGIKVLFSRFR